MGRLETPQVVRDATRLCLRARERAEHHHRLVIVLDVAAFIAVDIVVDGVPLGRETNRQPCPMMIGLGPDGGESDNGERRLGNPRMTLTQLSRRGSGRGEVLVLGHDDDGALPEVLGLI